MIGQGCRWHLRARGEGAAGTGPGSGDDTPGRPETLSIPGAVRSTVAAERRGIDRAGAPVDLAISPARSNEFEEVLSTSGFFTRLTFP